MLSAHSAVASRLEIHQSLASLSSLNLHRGLPSVRLHTRAQLHNIRSVCSVWMKKHSRGKKKHILEQECGGTNVHGAETHSHAQTASFFCTHSFLLQQHKSYQACCQGGKRETNTENEKDRRRTAQVWLLWNPCIFFLIMFIGAVLCV